MSEINKSVSTLVDSYAYKAQATALATQERLGASFHWSVPALLSAVLFGCLCFSPVMAVLRVPRTRFGLSPINGEGYVQNWRVIGPFLWTETPPAQFDSVADSSLGRQLDHRFLPDLAIEGGRSEGLPLFTNGKLARLYTGDNGLVQLHRIFDACSFRIAYAESLVNSDAERDVAMLAESDDAVKIWLNSSLVERSAGSRSIAQFQHYTRVHLRKGENTLIVKLVRTRETDPIEAWDFAVGFKTIDRALHDVLDKSVPEFIPNLNLSRGQALTVDLSLLDPGGTETAFVIQRNTRASFPVPSGKRTYLAVPNLQPGPFTVELKGRSLNVSEKCVYGDIDQLSAFYIDSLSKIRVGEQYRMEVDAISGRLRHLLGPLHRAPNDPIWQRKITDLVWTATALLNAPNSGRDFFKNRPGTFLRGFKSGLDGQDQFFLFHAPPEIVERAVPVVVIVPFTESPLRAFVESVAVADYRSLRVLDRASDRNGFAYLWFNNRGNTDGKPIGISELMRALDRAQQDYRIDPERIYLFGACSGGRDALELASLYPDKFAAIGLLSPAGPRTTTTSSEADGRSPTDAFAGHALAAHDPIALIANLQGIPIYDIHGDEDAHNPVSASEALLAAARSNKIPFTLNVVRGATHVRFPEDPHETVFRFFREKSRKQDPARIHYSSPSENYQRAYWLRINSFTKPGRPATLDAELDDGGKGVRVQTANARAFTILRSESPRLAGIQTAMVNGETLKLDPSNRDITILADSKPTLSDFGAVPALPHGPLFSAFANPFLLVAGSERESKGQSWNEAQEFSRSWKRRFFTECTIKEDTDLTPSDLRDHNLILFGTPANDSPLYNVLSQGPARVTRQGAILGGSRFNGDELAVQSIFPNPLQRDRYIVSISGPGASACPADAIQLALKAWYEAAIWEKAGDGSCKLVSVGSFDSEWKRFIPSGTDDK